MNRNCDNACKIIVQWHRHVSTSVFLFDAAQPPSAKHRADHDDDKHRSVVEKVIDDQSRSSKQLSTNVHKVRESATDLTYILFGMFGLACLGALAYMVVTEFVMPNSSQAIFRRSLRLLRAHDEVCAYFGTPLRGFGEETRRGRRRNVTHLEYVKDGEERMRMVFYIRGPAGDGSVQLEMKMGDGGKYEYRYLLVESNEHPRRSFVIVDNR